jgi:anaerobic ribonucleoside-triphosphate reductase activating protein
MKVHQTSDHGCRRMSVLNLAGFLARSAANGPGIRAVVWVQGCPHRCRGCFNPSSWSFSPATTITSGELAARILAVGGIDGVTFSGGEPFAQAGELAIIGELVRDAGLTIVTYTGYTYEQLTARADPAGDRLLAVTDLLIAGPYIDTLACNDPYIGSSNQQVIALTDRIHLPSPHGHAGEIVEFSIAPDGAVTATGFPREQVIRQIAARCRGE